MSMSMSMLWWRARSLPFLAVSLLGSACSSNDEGDSDLAAQVTANGEQLNTLAMNVSDRDTKLADLDTKLRAVQGLSMTTGVELERLKAATAVSGIASCYGRGHDAVVPGEKADQSEALAILHTCFASDVQSQFRYFGAAVQPSDQLDGLGALVEYIGSFWANAGYHSARNVPGNTHVELVDSRHATLSYSGTTPHFSVAEDDANAAPGAARAGFIDAISASYSSEVELGEDDVWRTTRFEIDIKEVIRVNGSYWIAQ